MESHKQRIRKLVELTNSEKRGMLFFLFLVFLILYIPKIHDRYFDDNIELAAIEAQIEHPSYVHTKPYKEKKEIEYSMHSFDPNKSSVQELNALGLPVYLSKRIVLYRKSGGRYKTKEDLLKIYGLDEEHYNRLKPFISIEEKEKVNRTSRIEKTTYVKSNVFLDVNVSDSAEFVNIRGIGPTYSSRIIKYRSALGGFYNVEQVREVYGISDSLYAAIQGNIYIDTISTTEKLSINRIGIKGLKTHPYFRSYNLCNAIVKYRDQHGNFKSVDELKNVHLINDSIFEKISPYLSFE